MRSKQRLNRLDSGKFAMGGRGMTVKVAVQRAGYEEVESTGAYVGECY